MFLNSLLNNKRFPRQINIKYINFLVEFIHKKEPYQRQTQRRCGGSSYRVSGPEMELKVWCPPI